MKVDGKGNKKKGQIILDLLFLGKPLKSVDIILEQEGKTCKKKGSEKGTSDYMGVELYYTGETELLSVENSRPEGEKYPVFAGRSWSGLGFP